MNNQEQFNEYRQERALLEHHSDMLDALDRLKVNPDFIKLYAHYTEDHVKTLVSALSPLVKSCENTDTIHKQLEGISHLIAFIKTVELNGNSAKESLSTEEE